MCFLFVSTFFTVSLLTVKILNEITGGEKEGGYSGKPNPLKIHFLQIKEPTHLKNQKGLRKILSEKRRVP